MTFFSKLTKRILSTDSLLCVGLDPHTQDLSSISRNGLRDFCLPLIEQTHDLVAAYKPNIAFFEALGTEGIKVLREVIESIPDDIPVILDAKRGDISSTASAYKQAVFDTLAVDAVTLNPYLGYDSIAPFIESPQNGAFLLCKTSNPGASDIQDLLVVNSQLKSPQIPLYLHIAKLAQAWNKNDNLGLVVGATKTDSLAKIRQIALDLWILCPGVGAQGGDLQRTLQAGLRADGLGLLIPISRGISRAQNPRKAVLSFNKSINQERKNIIQSADLPKDKEWSSSYQHLADGLLEAGCIKFGHFTLKSGLKSPFYIDLRRLTGYPELLSDVASEYIKVLKKLNFNHIAALPYAALPIASAISIIANWSMVYPRKESKNYGTRAQVEGIYKSGDRVVVIDDLITTGSSKVEGIQKLESEGLVVNDVVVLINRSFSLDFSIGNKRIELHSIINFRDLMEYYVSKGKISTQTRSLVNDYLDNQKME